MEVSFFIITAFFELNETDSARLNIYKIFDFIVESNDILESCPLVNPVSVTLSHIKSDVVTATKFL